MLTDPVPQKIAAGTESYVLQSTPSNEAAELQHQVLVRAARLLASADDFHGTLRQTIGACLPVLADFGFFDVVHGEDVVRTVAAHEAPEIEAVLAHTRWVKQLHPRLNLCALSTGEPALHPDIDDGWYRQAATGNGHLRLLRELAFRSMITVPVRYRSELVGALTLIMGRSGRRHTPQDLAFAAELALLAAPVVVNARLAEQHHQAETALRTSEERLRRAVEAGQVGIWDWDIERDQVTWSARLYEIYGREPGSDTGGVAGFRAHVHPEDRPRVEAALQAALAGGPEYRVEYRTVLGDGRTRWIATQAHVVREPQGRPVRVIGGCTDVTERVELLAAERAARAQAEAARRRLELLARAGAELSGSLDADETLQAIAKVLVPAVADWCRIDLLDDEGVLQRRLAYHTDPQRAQRALEMSRRLRAAPGTVGSMAWTIANCQPFYGRFDEPRVLADPALREYTQAFGMHAHCILPLVARGRTIGAMGVVQAESGRDLSEDDRALVQELGQRAALALDNARLYREAETARRQAEAANRAKDEFLAMLGHELRNPLAPIASALDLMARRDPHAGVQERHIIGRQVQHLSRLIDDLLDVSRITQGKIQLRREAVDMKAVVANAVELTRSVFELHEHPLELRLTDAAMVVQGDAVRLTQVLCNLLINAGKFTPATGRVRLSLDVSESQVHVAVQDEGRGMAPELLSRVFEPFVQGRQDIDRQPGGLGLGLAIVRSLVELHGGRVAAASEGLGRGSRFDVWLPLADGAMLQPLPPPSAAPAAGSGRLLVVDDNADAAETLSELLRLAGYEVRSAGHAKAALAMLDEFDPQLALLDIGLPEINGYQLAGMVRAHPRGAGMRLVALTGYGQDNDRAQALAARFDEHLVKPVAAERLFELIARLLP